MSQLVDRLAKNKIYGHEKKRINCVRNVVLGNGRAQVKEQIQTLVGQVMRLAFIDKTPNRVLVAILNPRTLQKQIHPFDNYVIWPGGLALMNREPITFRNLLTRARLRDQNVCVT
jgi:hypothetical protein